MTSYDSGQEATASTMEIQEYLAWLQYRSFADNVKQNLRWLQFIFVEGTTAIMDTAIAELKLGLSKFLMQDVHEIYESPTHDGIVLGVLGKSMNSDSLLSGIDVTKLATDGYMLQTVTRDSHTFLVIAGKTDVGCLYGVYHLLRLLSVFNDLTSISIIENPGNSIRMINHWDNIDGSIERGYAGSSLFYEDGKIVSDLVRIQDYARLLASIGINALSINNVNVHALETRLITDDYLPQAAEIAKIFSRYGIRVFFSVNFASPITIGGLRLADPLNSEVCNWWSEIIANIYRHIPDFGGFLVKADSEFQPGPFTYGRDHADGANMLAEALEPYHGLLIWRCFVYNCTQDWRDRKTDRARAAYDHFVPLDGKFKNNVILQIKNGPMDFQVREPVSPLIGGLKNTNQLLEFQVTQEYTGQQRHLCYLVPQWKQVLDFDTFSQGAGSTVSKTVSGSLYENSYGGIVGVSNVGRDMNWTGHTLAQANLYGFGRLAWNPQLSTEEITLEWVRLTFGSEQNIVKTISKMLLESWSIYEHYTAPLGVGWMVTPNHHYGPDVDGYEYSKWGTYHFADCHGIGVDRTINSGTGYTSQYLSPNADMYEDPALCPEELLLFFHHVPYTYLLKSGKTVIQHIYDTHFAGVKEAENLKAAWESLQGMVDDKTYHGVLARLEHQVEHAKEWRDVINTYFYRKSGIPDAHRRTIY